MAIIPRPTDVFDWAMRTASGVASVPGRVFNLLDAAEAVVARADALARRTEEVVAGADAAVAESRRVTAAVVAQVEAAEPLMRFAGEFGVHEVNAAIKLVDELPQLANHMTEDIMPILATLDRVGPDIHELLDVANDVRQAILGIPGFDFLRRRGGDRDGDKDGDKDGDRDEDRDEDRDAGTERTP